MNEIEETKTGERRNMKKGKIVTIIIKLYSRKAVVNDK